MKKFPHACLQFLLLLACVVAVVSTSGQEQAPSPSLTTAQARQQALSQLQAERTRLEGLVGAEVELVKVLNQIAELQLKFSNLDAAFNASNASLPLARQVATDSSVLVDTLTLAATVHIRRNEINQALPLLGDALTLSRTLDYRSGEAGVLERLGTAYYESNEKKKAEQSNDEALQVWRELQDKRGEARTLNAQGEIYVLQDRSAEALAVFKSSETIWRSEGDSYGLVPTLINIAFLAMRQGQWQSALGVINEAEALVDKEAEPYVAGQISIGLGLLYEAYGQLETARSYLEDALRYYRDGAHNKRAASDAGSKLGRMRALLGDYVGAIQQITDALRVAEETNNTLNIGLCHEDLGRVWLEAGSYESARLEFRLALEYFEKDSRPWARSQSYLGQVEFLSGNMDLAGKAYEEALRVFQGEKVLDYTNEAVLRLALGKLALKQGDLNEAEAHLQRSIDLTEQLREYASSEDLRSSFLDSVHSRYETYVELLMERDALAPNSGVDIKAYQASEAGRARALLDSLRNYQRELRQPSDPSLLSEEKKLVQEERRLIDERTRIISEGGSDKARTEVENKLKEVGARYETLQARINTNPKFINLLRAKPLSFEAIRDELIDAETSLLTYSLGDGKSFAWLITPEGLTTYRLADKRTIQNAANELISLLQSPATTPDDEVRLQNAINQVSRLVVEPLSAKLRGSRLIIVADGVLQYVPFQILKTVAGEDTPLVSRFDIVDAPSASTLVAVRKERVDRKTNEKLLVGFGDAVFSSDYAPPSANTENSNVSVSRSDLSKLRKLPRLFNARRELRAIHEVAGNDTTFYVEYAATRDNLLQVDLGHFRILHVVTHGVLDTNRPQLSGLVLSMVNANKQPINGFVSLGDIYKLRAPVDLVVLSACHTALGQQLRGEGLIGLTRGFMYAGASGVVSSLWRVDDKATAQLMKYFYSHMLQDGMGPAAALRAAQNTMRMEPEWSSPHYWAGFTFQGDYNLNIKATPGGMRSVWMYIVAAALIAVLAVIAYRYYRHRTRQA